MGEISDIVNISDEALESIVGGVLTEAARYEIRRITEGLKRIDISLNNAIEWWYEQTAGVSYSDKDHQEIEEIVRSVYAE